MKKAGKKAQGPTTSPPIELEISAIDRVWSGHDVRFALLEAGERVFVAYYDANRQLTVASRPMHAAAWVLHKLGSWVGWDSHNYIVLAADAAGHLHLAANMHADPLVYFRTLEAGDVRSFRRVAIMAEEALERRVTYPIFLRDAEGRLIFKYRDGRSGNGSEIYNRYDAAAGRWAHLLTTPLADGEGSSNAYFVGPVAGPDGWFHLVWVWRDSPDAETNHDLSYAKSRDLVHWQRADGESLNLPITPATAEIVDPVPVEQGMINNNTAIGFDAEGRPIVTYHKFDRGGNTQIHLARWQGDHWVIAKITRWKKFRWDFRGRGSLLFRLSVEGAVPIVPDRLSIGVVRDGKAIDLIVDAASLKLIEEKPVEMLVDQVRKVEPMPKDMAMNIVTERWSASTRPFSLAWPSRSANRDVATRDISEPTTLLLVREAAPDEQDIF